MKVTVHVCPFFAGKNSIESHGSRLPSRVQLTAWRAWLPSQPSSLRLHRWVRVVTSQYHRRTTTSVCFASDGQTGACTPVISRWRSLMLRGSIINPRRATASITRRPLACAPSSNLSLDGSLLRELCWRPGLPSSSPAADWCVAVSRQSHCSTHTSANRPATDLGPRCWNRASLGHGPIPVRAMDLLRGLLASVCPTQSGVCTFLSIFARARRSLTVNAVARLIQPALRRLRFHLAFPSLYYGAGQDLTHTLQESLLCDTNSEGKTHAK